VADPFQKSRLGAARFDAEKSHGVVDHHPQPGQHSVLRARGFVHVVDLCTFRPIGDSLIVGLNRLRDAIDTLLNNPDAHGKAKHGLAKVRHSLSRATPSPAQLPDKSRETRAVSCRGAPRHRSFGGGPTSRTISFLKKGIRASILIVSFRQACVTSGVLGNCGVE